MSSQESVEHDNNFRVNYVKPQDCRRSLAGDTRTKAGNDPTRFKRGLDKSVFVHDFSLSNIELLGFENRPSPGLKAGPSRTGF
jgi:hypothetical protein